jgi:hypothetical protein
MNFKEPQKVDCLIFIFYFFIFVWGWGLGIAIAICKTSFIFTSEKIATKFCHLIVALLLYILKENN